ncbi:MAG: VWA domain-containing protein [Flavobacteriales bacterium]|jgi:Ca-activated chloride channel homolog|nr:VWA domain-containing protein [Flavobacteriales bacterium]
MLRYDNIEYLYLLLLIPIIILAIIIYSRWQKRSIKKFGDSQLIEQLMQSHSNIRKKIKHILFILSITLLIIGLSNPQIGTKMEEVKREGVDLMIAIDLSYSMMAQDIKPNRLERAKQAISRLIDKLEGDRIGLVVFAGEAYVQLPITTDYSAAKLFLSTVNTSIVPTQGTKIGNAIDLCVNSFDNENAQSKAIIIITDGEAHDEEAISSAKLAQENGIYIHTLGMGLTKGGPIPIYNKYGSTSEFRKDREGNTIITKLNEPMLQEIAQVGMGTYVRANNSKSGLSILFDEINKMEKKEIGTMIFTDYKDRFQIFIGMSLFLLILNIFLLQRKTSWNTNINLYK